MPISSDALEQRLVDLEVKLSFTDDLLEHLNATVARQQEQIDLLLRELLQLRRQSDAEASPTFRSLRDEIPPHY
ncbi:SlyX family protein [Ideonella sp. B7]|uniref:SlyX family protein n=1 Tax=Ideonella benzenivorans TaxID=2831643 RepID=UPI001CED631A|nr:SlyX family protein [Ideonella benzenivorans]MCA6216361.1 SlyX family protein [Ideonella benzenivorans]